MWYAGARPQAMVFNPPGPERNQAEGRDETIGVNLL
jgi:hypothetical protein